jgi:hypothetical protein
MQINERADNFLLEYTIKFNATQRRGYRTNYFPWTRSAKDGFSKYETATSYNQNNITNDNTNGINISNVQSTALLK